MQPDIEHESFWRLDNSAVFTAAISSKTGPFVFRLSCELKDTVDADALGEALKKAARRFPYFFVTLRDGLFWHYFEPCFREPVPEREHFMPCARRRGDRHKRLCRVYAYGRTISCEFHHAITDGTGGMIFLRALVIEYLAATGSLPLDERSRIVDFVDLSQDPDPEEWEDSYRKHFKPESPHPDHIPKAWLVPGMRMRGGYRVTCATVPVQAVLALAREKKASLTELVTAVYMLALQRVYRSERNGKGPARGNPITVQVPVNLRPIYPSKTMRNFFLFAAPSIDPRLGEWTLEEIVERVHHQMKLGVTQKEFYRYLKRNVGGEFNPLGRGVPLPIKNLALKAFNRRLNLDLYTGSISNMSVIKMDERAAAFVERFVFIPPSNLSTGVNVGILSWGESLYITIGSTVGGNAVEREFLTALAGLGLEVSVESATGLKSGR